MNDGQRFCIGFGAVVGSIAISLGGMYYEERRTKQREDAQEAPVGAYENVVVCCREIPELKPFAQTLLLRDGKMTNAAYRRFQEEYSWHYQRRIDAALDERKARALQQIGGRGD